METNKHTKCQMVKHIYGLFKMRPKTLRTARWHCVLSSGSLMVTRAFSIDPPADKVILDCFLKPGQLPSLVSICQSVRKNWDVLVEANVEIPTIFDVAGSKPATNNIKDYMMRPSWLINCIQWLKKIRSFIANRICRPGKYLPRRYF